jgi:hypothetical protein
LFPAVGDEDKKMIKRRPSPDVVEHLLKVGRFDVNSRCNDPANWCPLAAAIRSNHLEMARLLVDRFKAGKKEFWTG